MKEYIKNNYKFIVSLILIFLILNIRFPYYIDTPGGISDISKKVEMNGYESKGSFNLAYVKEYKATIPTLLISLFKKDWKILENDDVLLDTENDKSYSIRDKILLKESISDAIYVAYKKSDSYIKINSNKLIVIYILGKSNTNLSVGDEIISINNINVNTKNEITDIVNSLNIGDKIDIQVKNNNKLYNKYAYIIGEEDSKRIGMLISNIREYETNPKIKINVDNNESGSSGGLITALYIYNSLVPDDITHGLTIVGTGTIDQDGNVGSIGGVEYKLKSAVKSKADLFIVPIGENYNDSIKLKKENNYKIDIIGVSNFDEVIDYLNDLN